MTVVANVQNDSKIESRKRAKLGTFCSSLCLCLSLGICLAFSKKNKISLKKKICVLKVFICKNR